MGLGEYKLNESDFQCLSNRFNLNSSELKAEIKLLKTKKDQNLPPNNALNRLDWLSKHGRETTYENFSTLMKDFPRFQLRAALANDISLS